MRPPKKLIERAKENGAIDRLNRLVSLAYLLQSVATNLHSEAEDLLRENGLLLGELKQDFNRLQAATDRYTRSFSAMVTDKDCAKAYWHDFEELDAKLRSWAKIDEQPKNTPTL